MMTFFYDIFNLDFTAMSFFCCPLSINSGSVFRIGMLLDISLILYNVRMKKYNIDHFSNNACFCFHCKYKSRKITWSYLLK